MAFRSFSLSGILLLLLTGLFPGCNTSDKKIDDRTDFNRDTTSIDQFAINISGNERLIDMDQFERTALNIPYTNTESERQQLDIIYPENGEAPYKFIVVFHGGGWMAGSKNSATVAPLYKATTQGYAVVPVNYRLAENGKWPNNLYDAKAAIRFLRANAEELELDAEHIVVWGASTGGYLAQMLAATNGDSEYEDKSMGHGNASSEVQGVVSWYGISDVMALHKHMGAQMPSIMGIEMEEFDEGEVDAELSPIEHVDENYPPILLVHGTEDEVVPYEQSEKMEEKVNEATGSETAELKLVEGAGHGGEEIQSNEAFAQDLNFVDSILYPEGNPHRSEDLGDIEILRLEETED